MPWTLRIVELDVELAKKECTRCKEFKSVELFYKQSGRYESLCKNCKKEARNDRKDKKKKPDDFLISETEQNQTVSAIPEKELPKSYEDLGLTRNEFLEVVEFFKELMRLDQKGR